MTKNKERFVKWNKKGINIDVGELGFTYPALGGLKVK